MQLNEKKIILESVGVLKDWGLTEGTWAIPFKKQQAIKLANVMKKPIKAKEAGDLLYSLVGDDELFDLFDDMIKKNEGEDDVRVSVVYTLVKWLKDYRQDPSQFKEKFSFESAMLIQKLAKRYNIPLKEAAEIKKPEGFKKPEPKMSEAVSSNMQTWFQNDVNWTRKPDGMNDLSPVRDIPTDLVAEILKLPVYDSRKDDVFYGEVKGLPQYFLVHDGKKIGLVDTQGFSYARYAVELVGKAFDAVKSKALKGSAQKKMSDAEFVNLEPRVTKKGLKVYPAIIKGKQMWVSIPEESIKRAIKKEGISNPTGSIRQIGRMTQTEASKEYGVRWFEFNRQDQKIGKQKIFNDRKKRDKFADELEKKDNFAEFDSWLNPSDEQDEMIRTADSKKNWQRDEDTDSEQPVRPARVRTGQMGVRG
jgi:hypothetical protein